MHCRCLERCIDPATGFKMQIMAALAGEKCREREPDIKNDPDRASKGDNL